MSRLAELENEIAYADQSIIKMLIQRVRLGEERHDLMDGVFPEPRDALRLAELQSARMGSMLQAGGISEDSLRMYVERFYHSLVLQELEYKTALSRSTTVPSWVDIARGRAARGR